MRLLDEWGKWAKHDPNGLGYQSPFLALMRGKVQISDNRPTRYNISDEEALAVDRAVSNLKYKDAMLHAVLVLKYYDRYSMKQIAEASKNTPKPFGKRTGWQLLGKAEMFVEGQLFTAQGFQFA